MRKPSTKLVLIGAPGSDLAQIGLSLARSVGRPFFEHVAGSSDDARREWFGCIMSTAGPAVIAVDCSFGSSALDVRTRDHWIVFVDDGSGGALDSDLDGADVRERADIVVDSAHRDVDDIVDEIARAWKQRRRGLTARSGGA